MSFILLFLILFGFQDSFSRTKVKKVRQKIKKMAKKISTKAKKKFNQNKSAWMTAGAPRIQGELPVQNIQTNVVNQVNQNRPQAPSITPTRPSENTLSLSGTRLELAKKTIMNFIKSHPQYDETILLKILLDIYTLDAKIVLKERATLLNQLFEIAYFLFEKTGGKSQDLFEENISKKLSKLTKPFQESVDQEKNLKKSSIRPTIKGFAPLIQLHNSSASKPQEGRPALQISIDLSSSAGLTYGVSDIKLFAGYLFMFVICQSTKSNIMINSVVGGLQPADWKIPFQNVLSSLCLTNSGFVDGFASDEDWKELAVIYIICSLMERARDAY